MEIVLFLVIIATLVVIFLPRLKGFRTKIFGYFVTVIGAIVPLITQITEYLQTLDWRQYILNGQDTSNMKILAVTASLGILIIILRYMTNTKVNNK